MAKNGVILRKSMVQLVIFLETKIFEIFQNFDDLTSHILVVTKIHLEKSIYVKQRHFSPYYVNFFDDFA
jgi:hypothetical protein